jgi:ferredoxin
VKVVVTVDPRACVANQACKSAAPGLFELVPNGYSQPTRNDFEESDLPSLYEAEDHCPTGAIRVEIEES